MVTYAGDLIYLDNLVIGCMKNENDPGTIYLAFTDNDNEKTYLIPVALEKVETYFEHVRASIAKMKIVVAGADEMPTGGNDGTG